MKTDIPIHITPHHLSITPALARFVQEKMAKLPRIAGDALAADIVLRRHHGTAEGKLFSASARVALPGRDVHAAATHEDLYTAIGELERTLARGLRKRKTRLDRRAKNLHRAPRVNGGAMAENAQIRWSRDWPSAAAVDAFRRAPAMA